MSDEKTIGSASLSRNAPCPCGSGKKYKLCCGAKAVAAEREVQEKKSRFWTPEGVTSEVDDTKSEWPNGRPKWNMSLPIDQDGDPAEDARCVIEKLVRPYFDRYCELAEGEESDSSAIAIVECFESRGDPLAASPRILNGRKDQLWEMLHNKLENFLANCQAPEVYCEVRWDHIYGGPIVYLEDDGASSMYFVSLPEEYGKD